jgi:hypothetical protein
MLQFVKIVNMDIKKDDLSAVLETRSLSLEYLSMQKLIKIYEDFLKQFPTKLEDDMAILRDEKKAK